MSDANIILSTGLSRLPGIDSPKEFQGDHKRQENGVSGNLFPQSTDPGTNQPVTEKPLSLVGQILSEGRELKFHVSKSTSDIIITVWNAETGELVRQIPSKEMEAIAQFIAENAPEAGRGLFVDDTK